MTPDDAYEVPGMGDPGYPRPQDIQVRRVPRALCAWLAALGMVGVAVLWSHVIAPWIAGWLA